MIESQKKMAFKLELERYEVAKKEAHRVMDGLFRSKVSQVEIN